ncbi:MAG: hypothetical protein DRP70_06380 [Spirochaetes bacterium]|nr:MAG: hypothetical protein DRP70_06380 [Spirochaetota bacterium]RKX98348.1 MAG: hypothetical protein DRZ90_03200 [Spirochaetota bacterium]
MLSLFFAEATATILMIQYHLTIDILAVRLTVPLVGPVEDFHLQVDAPCRAHEKEGGKHNVSAPFPGREI